MIAVERLTGDAAKINAFVNHPAIFPEVAGDRKEPFDLTPVVKDPNHVVLVSDHGGMIFIKHQNGVYEFHSAVLPEYRGRWTMLGAQAAFRWMFARTDACELLTKCPKGNLAATAGARAIGMDYQWTTRPIWPTPEGAVPVDIYSLSIQKWAHRASDLVERGQEFHAGLGEQLESKGLKQAIHPDDEIHDRYVGAAIAMIEGGVPVKGIWFYNRWAAMSGYAPVTIVKTEPLIINISSAFIRVTEGGFEVLDANGRN